MAEPDKQVEGALVVMTLTWYCWDGSDWTDQWHLAKPFRGRCAYPECKAESDRLRAEGFVCSPSYLPAKCFATPSSRKPKPPRSRKKKD